MYEKKLIKLLEKSYSQFHVVENIKDILEKNGFKRVLENFNKHDLNNNKIYLSRNGTSIIAIELPEDCLCAKPPKFNILVTATHNDSPTYKLKPNPIFKSGNLTQINVEPYGGMIHSTWLDRPLSFAGRVVYRRHNIICKELINIDKDLLIIPNTCIHLRPELNNGAVLNPAVDLLPIISSKDLDFNNLLKKQIGKNDIEILSHDLYLYNRDEPRFVGLNNDFIVSPRIDDLASTYSVLEGFINSKSNVIKVFASFDSEEVGSLSRQGAQSDFLSKTLSRLFELLDDYDQISGFLLSVDNGHANHPNHPELSDKTTNVQLNKGVVIKYNANQKYTTDSVSAAYVKALCIDNKISYQEYTNRSDLRGGSTLGNLLNSQISFISSDIGLPQLAMHSSNETCGAKDIDSLVDLIKVYFEKLY